MRAFRKLWGSISNKSFVLWFGFNPVQIFYVRWHSSSIYLSFIDPVSFERISSSLVPIPCGLERAKSTPIFRKGEVTWALVNQCIISIISLWLRDWSQEENVTKCEPMKTRTRTFYRKGELISSKFRMFSGVSWESLAALLSLWGKDWERHWHQGKHGGVTGRNWLPIASNPLYRFI